MPSLLELPLEVRNEIYRWVIDSAIKPPPSPALEKERRRALRYRNYLSPAIFRLPIAQDGQEVTRFLQFLRTTDYSVDIVYINSVRAILRTPHRPAALPDHFRDDAGIGPGSDFNIVIPKYLDGLLSTLFKRGPGFLGRSRNRRQVGARVALGYVVNHIIIDVVSTTEASGQSDILAGVEQGDEDGPTSPEERLATRMIRFLEHILGPPAFLPLVGMMLYEQIIGSIVFMVNGKEIRTIKVEECLQHWGARRLTKASPEIMQKHREWKHWVDGRRARMKQGLDLDSVRLVPNNLWSGR
ncbi:unnamed protein product [Clonostachys rosea]|uniref:Uncharacterized protein n=1 Tax=Bionectria ochroleuca TaxID=29856 RepID=A0ABY6UTT4_BIOOC|nr:unnamed protein product [Clonostachys rosea]